MKYILNLILFWTVSFSLISCSENDISEVFQKYEMDEFYTIPLIVSLEETSTKGGHIDWAEDAPIAKFDETGSFLYSGYDIYSMENNDIYLNIYVNINGKWSDLVTGSARLSGNKDTTITKDGLILMRKKGDNKINIYYRISKRNPPKDIKFAIVSSLASNGIPLESYQIKILNDKPFLVDEHFDFNNFLGSEDADAHFYSFIEYSNIDFENFKPQTITAKRFGSRITYISDCLTEYCMPSWGNDLTYLSNLMMRCFPVSSNFIINSNTLGKINSNNVAPLIDYTKFVYNLEDDRLYSIPFDYLSDNTPFLTYLNKSPISVPSQNNKQFYPIGAYILPTSDNGNHAVISNIDNLNNSPGNETISYILSIITVTNNFKAVLLPLPEKLYPNKRYVIRNKPGVKIFPDEYTPFSQLQYLTRSDISKIKVVSPDDVIIEEYDN